MNKVTLEEFNKIKPEEVFARGIAENSPRGIFMTRQGGLLRWVAIKGYGNDWAAYCLWENEPESYILTNGDKVPKSFLKNIITLTDEVLALYRE